MMSQRGIVVVFQLLRYLQVFQSHSGMHSDDSSLLIAQLSIVVVYHAYDTVLANVVTECSTGDEVDELLLMKPYLPFAADAQFSYQQFPPVPDDGFHHGFCKLCHVSRVGVGGNLGCHVQFHHESYSFFIAQVFDESGIGAHIFQCLIIQRGVLLVFAMSEHPDNIFTECPDVLFL